MMNYDHKTYGDDAGGDGEACDGAGDRAGGVRKHTVYWFGCCGGVHYQEDEEFGAVDQPPLCYDGPR